MSTFTIGMRVRIIAEAFTRAGQIGTLVYVDPGQANAIVKFDDGEELGYLIDDDEIEAVTTPQS